jgi:hypothetical protein
VERVETGLCGICKSELSEGPLALCTRCRALYHESCWIYNGGRCAAYGCPRAHAERDPLPSLSVVRWVDPQTVKTILIIKDLPPVTSNAAVRRDVSRVEWILTALIVIAAFSLVLCRA